MGTIERPILFNTEMVRAILDGRKTQTRRPLKPQPVHVDPVRNIAFKSFLAGPTWPVPDPYEIIKPLFGEPGNLLWVRETWNVDSNCCGPVIFYRATDTENCGPWKPSIHMPKECARIWLRVKRVWLERLQDISEEDAKAEGIVDEFQSTGDDQRMPSSPGKLGISLGDSRPRFCFAYLWEDIYKSRGFGWDENPWVWCCEFERIER